eukprot:10800944-Ditylum_brightwellii.AAC.1
MVISLHSTIKESRIGACHGPEESTAELEDNNSSSTTMESFFEGNIREAMKEFRKMMWAKQVQNAMIPAQKSMDYLELKLIEK